MNHFDQSSFWLFLFLCGNQRCLLRDTHGWRKVDIGTVRLSRTTSATRLNIVKKIHYLHCLPDVHWNLKCEGAALGPIPVIQGKRLRDSISFSWGRRSCAETPHGSPWPSLYITGTIASLVFDHGEFESWAPRAAARLSSRFRNMYSIRNRACSFLEWSCPYCNHHFRPDTGTGRIFCAFSTLWL